MSLPFPGKFNKAFCFDDTWLFAHDIIIIYDFIMEIFKKSLKIKKRVFAAVLHRKNAGVFYEV